MKKILENTSLGKKLGKKGLYITLSACLLAAGGAGIAAYNKTVDDLNDKIIITPSSSKNDEPKMAADNKKDDVKKDESSDENDDIQTQPNVMPVNGEILNPFSNGELVKSETLGVWKTHDGVDIKGELGSPVKAMNKGKVTKIEETALLGNCITIDHGNGVTGYYCNLSKEMNVTEGDQVNAGEIIGAIGDTAESEVAELSHIHFALKKNGSWIDPIEFIDSASSK